MTPAWEIERGTDPVLRWVCVLCHLLNSEHRDQWWGCVGRWIAQGK